MVSQQALSTFLSRPFETLANDPVDKGSSFDSPQPLNSTQNGLTSDHCKKVEQGPTTPSAEISVEEILCPHSKLDPGKARYMKRIDRVCCIPRVILLIDAQIPIDYVRVSHTDLWFNILPGAGAH